MTKQRTIKAWGIIDKESNNIIQTYSKYHCFAIFKTKWQAQRNRPKGWKSGYKWKIDHIEIKIK